MCVDQETFEEQPDPNLWPVIVGGEIGTECGTISLGNSLVMNNLGRRYVITGYLNLTGASCVQFTLQIGSSGNFSLCQMDSDPQSNVIFGYTLNGGLSWTVLQSFEYVSMVTLYIQQSAKNFFHIIASYHSIQLLWVYYCVQKMNSGFHINACMHACMVSSKCLVIISECTLLRYMLRNHNFL